MQAGEAVPLTRVQATMPALSWGGSVITWSRAQSRRCR